MRTVLKSFSLSGSTCVTWEGGDCDVTKPQRKCLQCVHYRSTIMSALRSSKGRECVHIVERSLSATGLREGPGWQRSETWCDLCMRWS